MSKIGYKSFTSQDISRGPSGSIWGDFDAQCALEERGGNFEQASYEFWEDFSGGWPGFIPFMSSAHTLASGAFGTATIGQWTVGGLDGTALFGTAADSTNLPFEGGWAALKPASATSPTVLMALAGHAFGFVDASSSSGKLRPKMYFECSVALSALASTNNALFIGLAGLDGGATSTPVSAANFLQSSTLASGLVNTNSFFGFFKPSASPLVNAANPAKTVTGSLFNDFLVAYNVAAGTIQFPGSASNLWTLLSNNGFNPNASGTAQPLSAATFTSGAITTPSSMKVKLGWVYDPTSTAPQLSAPAAITTNQTASQPYKGAITFYVNGQRSGAFLIPADIQASTFPSAWMMPTISFQGGTGIGYFDWIRCGQLGSY